MLSPKMATLEVRVANSEQLFTEVEVNSGGYLPSRDAVR